MPRSEADNRIGHNERELTRKVDKDVLVEVDRRYEARAVTMHADIERLKDDVVSRAENQGRWNDYTSRLDKLSDRLTEMQKSSNGATLAEQIRSIQNQLEEFQRKFIVAPQK